MYKQEYAVFEEGPKCFSTQLANQWKVNPKMFDYIEPEIKFKFIIESKRKKIDIDSLMDEVSKMHRGYIEADDRQEFALENNGKVIRIK